MNKTTLRAAALVLAVGLLAAAAGLLCRPTHADGKGERPFGIPERTPWTTSRVTGSPEPPPPYRVGRAFPKLTFRLPLLMVTAPGSDRWFVGEEEGKLFSFRKDENVTKADLFCDLTKEIHSWDKDGKVRGVDSVRALAFHPQFEKNRYCYVAYLLGSKMPGEQLPDGSRLSRFRVTDTDPPRLDVASEKVILTWLVGGHNGCDLHFGPDGFLYLSTGDGSDPNPPDRLDTGQDVSDLLSSILRIDVDHEENGRAYAIPADNPFRDTPNARPEVWAYGFRNPWRMSFDRQTGDLWVGDVGWELWEMVDRVKRGGNYGWSVMEGPQTVRPEAKRGPTPILPPTFHFPHTEAASITGGYVYRGKQHKDLIGAYLCGDWVTRRVWATMFDGDKVVWHKLIAQGTQRVVAFGQDHDGELFIVNHEETGTLHKLVPNERAAEHRPDFPKKLSETGLFASVKEHKPAPGVVPFSVNVEQWLDHATAERFVGLPGTSTVKVYDEAVAIPGGFFSGEVFFPKDGVLAKTIFLELERGNPKSRRRLETQVLHHGDEGWRGYAYRWNDEQTDAELVPAEGLDATLTVTDAKAPGGRRQQTWHFASRTECLTCHNPWAGYTLAFTAAQLNRDHDYGVVVDNQLRAFKHVGMVEFLHRDEDSGKDAPLAELPHARLTNPYDDAADTNERARSYLQVNCAHCHRFGAGGSVDMDLRFDTALERTKALEVRPAQGTFEIPGAHILSPGDPYRSVLYYRMAKLGRGRMPHIGSEVVDERGLKLMHDWIRQLPVRKDERLLVRRLAELDEPAILALEKAEWDQRLKRTARDIARNNNREAPNDDDRRWAEAELKARAAAGVKSRAAERADLIGRLLSSTGGALMLMEAVADSSVPESVRAQVLAAATASTDGQVRDLFERFVPDDKRLKRLGSVIRPEQILSLKGDAGRGKELFFKAGGLQCSNCHKVGGTGSNVGPDLSQVGKKLTRAQILESILEPSKTIDPQYVMYLAETNEGKVYSGLLAEKNDRGVVLKTAGDKEVRIPAARVTTLVPQQKSLMPDLLLRDVSAEQAADLLEFLSSLK